MTSFDHKKIEKKWNKAWKEQGTYKVDLKKAKKKWYNLMMFPYPSAEGLHVGNMYAFTGADIFGRYKAMQGYDVFEPIGLDGFGIHSENYAIKIGKHPKEQAKVSQKRFYEQLSRIGNRFSWEHRLETYDPEYYKWTQWLFIKMFENGLAYRKKSLVNWCPSCKTVLSDEQVEGGVCERCKTETEKKETFQWFFKITDYAQRLLDNIDKIDWPDKIKKAQRNWIGRSEGVEESWQVEGMKMKLKTFTTWPHTTWGATFMVIAPEHPVIEKLVKGTKYEKGAKEFIKKVIADKVKDPKNVDKVKEGYFLGKHVINPLSKRKMPLYIANFAIYDYGTGIVKCTPSHDERDFDFARKYKLPSVQVIDFNTETHSVVVKKSVNDDFISEVKKNNWYWMEYEDWGFGVVVKAEESKKYIETVQKHMKAGPWYAHTDGSEKVVIFKDKVFEIKTENKKAKEYAKKIKIPQEQIDWDKKDNYMFCYTGGGTGEGKMMNAGQFDGMDTEKARKAIGDYSVKHGHGKWTVDFKLRDWCISRQRYWGPPIPMIFCESCFNKGETFVKDKKMAGWWPEKIENLPVELPDVKDYKPTGDGKSPLGRASKDWLEVDCPKCGGKAKRETDVSDTFLDSSWYFLRYPMIGQGQTLSAPFDEEVTGKWQPVDAYIGGAEHAVLHLMYSRFVTMALKDWGMLGFEEPFPFLFGHGLIIKDGKKMSKSRGNIVNPDEYWDKYGVDALRMYLMFVGPYEQGGDFRDTGMIGMRRFLDRVWRMFSEKMGDKTTDKLKVKLEQVIKKVGGDLSGFHYNTAIAAMMELVNVWREDKQKMSKGDGKRLVKILAPLAPYVSEELWQSLGGKESVHNQKWPEFDEKMVQRDKVTVVVQVNGKLRGQMEVSREESENKTKMIKMAKELKGVKKFSSGKKVIKEVFVAGKLVNLVLK